MGAGELARAHKASCFQTVVSIQQRYYGELRRSETPSTFPVRRNRNGRDARCPSGRVAFRRDRNGRDARCPSSRQDGGSPYRWELEKAKGFQVMRCLVGREIAILHFHACR